MSVVAFLSDRIAGWVHESAQSDPHEAARHRAFISARLALGLMAFVLIPPYMALRGSLAPWEVAIVACAMCPLASAFALAKTGRFWVARTIALTGYIGACLCFAVGTGGASAPTLVWLALAPFEAVMSLSVATVVTTSAVVLLAFAGVVVGVATGVLPAASTIEPYRQLFIVAPAFCFAGVIGVAAVRMLNERARLARAGAARFDALASMLGDVVMRHDRTGAVLAVADESAAALGIAPRELMGRSFFERLLVQDRPSYLKAISDACDGARPTCELRLRTGDAPSARGDFAEPVFTWIELRARHVLESERADETTGPVISVVRDITNEKLRQEEIESARAEAERASAWKDRFLANISHELRTPLNAIIGFSEILGDDELMPADAAKRREYANIIHGSGQHLLSVVNSILDISKMEAGRFHITPEPFEVRPLIEACCDIVSLKAEQADVAIDLAVDEKLGELTADKRAFKQVLINLLSNALKFTPRGGRVTVGARQQGDFLSLYVSDTGCGVAPADLPRLGGAFFQAGSADDRTYEGTGLGLSVVRGLVGLHGGEISVESGVGAGTCVTVRLPLDCGEDFAGRASARIIAIPRPSPSPFERVGVTIEQGRKSA